ncbi:hypothetical protein SDC9_190193 [bioreactor metagenome]|uniref:Uncharacterized protein n=1 Tax=bioreactor metagenome TaxID=1076179 RepID=A0A645HVN6_9ZZZZ
MLVESGGAGVHRCHVQLDIDLAGLACLVELHVAALLVKAGTVGRGAKVIDLESRESVCGVDGVSGRCCLGSSGKQGRSGQGEQGGTHGEYSFRDWNYQNMSYQRLTIKGWSRKTLRAYRRRSEPA